MTYQGRWITGPLGTTRVVELSRRLNSLSLEGVNKRFGSAYSAFRPWMSATLRLPEFAEIAQKLPQNSPAVVTDPGILSLLDRICRGSKEHPLWYLGVSYDNGLAVETQDTERIRTFAQQVPAALNLLRAAGPALEARVDALLLELIPAGLSPKGRRRPEGRGMSGHHYRGGVFVDLPDCHHGDIELVLNLSHELGHQALMAYQNSDELIVGDLSAPVYSAIRKTERPAIKSLHAVVALSYMMEFAVLALSRGLLSGERQAYLIRRQMEIRADLAAGVGAFRSSKDVRLTPIGDAIIEECEQLEARMLLSSVAVREKMK